MRVCLINFNEALIELCVPCDLQTIIDDFAKFEQGTQPKAYRLYRKSNRNKYVGYFSGIQNDVALFHRVPDCRRPNIRYVRSIRGTIRFDRPVIPTEPVILDGDGIRKFRLFDTCKKEYCRKLHMVDYRCSTDSIIVFRMTRT